MAAIVESRAAPARHWFGWLAAKDTAHARTVRAATWAASGFMVASGVIHLHLYAAAYHVIPTIGPLFVVQGISAVVFALGAAILRRPWSALIGAGTMLATLAGFLISVNFGLFGFQDSFGGTNQVSSFVVELLAAALFLFAGGIAALDWRGEPRASAPLRSSPPARSSARVPDSAARSPGPRASGGAGRSLRSEPEEG
jgi:hypothetical protein